MVENKKKNPNKVKDWAFKVAIATIKATLVYMLYFVLSPYLAALSTVAPGFAETIELFVAITIVLMILSDLTANTIYQCFINVGRAIFMIGYLVFALGDGVLNIGLESFSLTVDLTVFYAIAGMLGLLGLARSVMQAINFMSQRAESGIKP
jgi:uncharacterized ion transporter superfamily protein YfcC